MGTNYYLQKTNPENGRCKDMHICKTSGGWTPSMRGYSYDPITWEDDFAIKNWKEWKWFLLKETRKGGIIFDEYDDPISLRKFFKKIEGWQHQEYQGKDRKLKNHAEEALKGSFDSDSHAKQCWIDPEGYSFHDGEFS